MSCAVQDVSSRTLANNDDPPKDLVYRPLHVLPGFTFVGQDWEARGLKEGDGLSSIRIDLLEGFTRAWKDLGFTQLDNTEKSFGKKDLEAIRRTIGEWKLELRYTEFQAFDVTRGLWYVTPPER